MARSQKVVTTVNRVLGADAVEHKGIVVRLLAKDGSEHHIQLAAGEAHGLVDMVAIALSRLPAPDHRPV